MILGDLLNTLASKCGLQQDQALIDLLSSSELAHSEVNDEFARRLDTGLMSLEGAKNNREVLNHLKPIILKAADDKFAVLAEKYGIADAMNAEQSTYKKIDILEAQLATKIADLEKKAQGTGGKETELTKQIADLQKQLATVTAAKDNELAAYKKQVAKEQLDALVNFELNGKRYANQDLGDTNVEIARALINKALTEQHALLVNENGTLKLKQAENPSLDFLDSGYKPVSFHDFTNKLLADKHLLEVSSDTDDDDHGGRGGRFTPQQPSTIKLKNGKEVDTSSIDAAAAASLADLE